MSSTSTPAKALGSRAMSHLRTPPPLHIPKMPSNYLPPQQIYPRKQSSQSNSSFSTSSSYTNPSHAYTHQALHPTGSFPPPQTEYMRMLLALDAIPTTHNILAGLSTWLLLAGFIIFPGTFNTLSKSQLSGTTGTIINTAQHIPLLVIASITSGLGLLGMGYIFFVHRYNYIWLCSKVFMPGVMNSSVGLLGTLVGVYGTADGRWGNTAVVTAGVTSGVLVGCGGLYVVYYFVLLRGVRRCHERDCGGEREQVGLGIREKGRSFV